MQNRKPHQDGHVTASSSLFFISLALFGAMTTQLVSSQQVYVHEVYAQKANTNRSVACGLCEARGGFLARRPQLDDWEILFGNWSHLDTMDFWVDLVQAVDGTWYWGDGVALDLSSVASLPMSAAFNQTYSGWHCAVWNMAEPFLMPANCNISTNVLCQVPTAEPACENTLLQGMKFNDTAVTGLVTASVADMYACNASCSTSSTCWAADWDSASSQCRLLQGATRPAVPDLVPDAGASIIGRTCIKMEEMSEADSDFVCNCGAMQLPTTEEEKEQFVEEYKEEVKKELIVPTETLSATVRKKESAPDERQSSTGLGYLGITMMVVVFGGLFLMDVTSLFAHAKMAVNNVKEIFGNAEQGSSDA